MSSLIRPGHEVVFLEEASFIRHRQTRQVQRMSETTGVYEMDFGLQALAAKKSFSPATCRLTVSARYMRVPARGLTCEQRRSGRVGRGDGEEEDIVRYAAGRPVASRRAKPTLPFYPELVEQASVSKLVLCRCCSRGSADAHVTRPVWERGKVRWKRWKRDCQNRGNDAVAPADLVDLPVVPKRKPHISLRSSLRMVPRGTRTNVAKDTAKVKATRALARQEHPAAAAVTDSVASST